MRSAKAFLFALALASLAACARSAQNAQPHPSVTPSFTFHPQPVVTPSFTFVPQTPLPLDIPRAFCHPWGDTNPHHGVWNYAVTQLGKPGVPKLTADQVAQLHAIARKQHPHYLRFALLPNGEFVVFDATQGACSPDAIGYPVLNEPGQNSFYEPGENPYYPHAGPPY